MKKKAINIDIALERISEAVEPWPKAAMFELAEDGFNSPFEQLVACMISIRTYDEVSLPTARKLFARASTPKQMSKLTIEEIDDLIHTCTFHERKAAQIHIIAQRVVDEFDGNLPCNEEILRSFSGVGPKLHSFPTRRSSDLDRKSVV